MDDQSTLHPASHAADEIADLWWILFAVSVVVFAVVLVLLLVGVLRRRGEGAAPDRAQSSGARLFVGVAGIAVPLVVVVALFFASVATLPAVAPAGKNASLTIDVVGKQWFWDATYPRSVRTSNEIHIPVGEPVELRVRSEDVVHSLWVPRLNRKIDLLPGKTNSLVLDARKPGVYRGQCAEFCGVQHGNMALFVIAEPRAAFERWLDRERGSSGEAAVFLGSGCGGCHRIAGTPAQSRYGPDLTGFGRRRTIGAGALTNTPDHLAEWLRDPQAAKPGNKMPALGLSDAEIAQLVRYLEAQR